jgi:hypothetical protein
LHYANNIWPPSTSGSLETAEIYFSCKISGFDLTPNFFGPSEGFLQAGCQTYVGFGFEQEHHTNEGYVS